MDHDNTGAMTRRTLLKSGAGVATAGAAVSATSTAVSAQQDAYDGYLEETPNFDGETADATGMDEITVMVGAGAQGLLFDPAAVVVDPGTTVNWEWTGEGGAHNVYHDADLDGIDEPIFNSGDAVNDEGVLYDFTFEDEHDGFHPYVCEPHRGQEMKGVIVVGEENVQGDTFPFGEADDGLNTIAIFGGAAMFGTVALLGISAYRDMFGEDEH